MGKWNYKDKTMLLVLIVISGSAAAVVGWNIAKFITTVGGF